MEMEQMKERLLAKIDARMDANIKAMHEKVDANLKELKEDIKTTQAKTNVNLKEIMEKMMNANQAKKNANIKEMEDQLWASANKIHSQCPDSGHEKGSKRDNVLPSNHGGVSGQ
jgi:hypothetical protein